MAQFIKKLQTGGDTELLKFKTQTDAYDAKDLLRQLELNEDKFLGLFKRKDRLHAFDAYNALKIAVNKGSVYQGDDMKWYGDGISDDPFVGYALSFALKIYSKMTPISEKTSTLTSESESESKTSSKTKFDAYKNFGLFFNKSYYNKSSESAEDLKNWQELDFENIYDDNDENKVLGNQNRLETMIDQLEKYKTFLSSDTKEYNWDTFTDKESFLSRLDQTINDLKSAQSIADRTQLTKTIRDALRNSGLSQLSSRVELLVQKKQEASLTDDQRKAQIELLSRYNPSYNYNVFTDDQLNSAYNDLIEKEKQKNEYESEYAKYAQENYKYARHHHTINIRNIADASDNKKWDEFVGGLNGDMQIFNDVLQLFSKIENADDILRFLNHNKKESGGQTKRYDLILAYVLLKEADAISNGKQSDTLIKIDNRPDEYIILGSITPNGQAWKYNVKTGKLLWITAKPGQTPTLNRILRQRYDNTHKVSQWKSGGTVKEKENKILKADVGTTILEDYNKRKKSKINTDNNNNGSSQKVEFTSADKLRIGGMAADLLSSLSAFFPGLGTAASAITGVASTTTNLIADIKDNVGFWNTLGNAGLGLTLDVAGLVPGVGEAAHLSKITKNAIKWLPKIMTAYGGFSTFKNGEQISSCFSKIINGDWDNMTKEELIAGASALLMIAAGTNVATGSLKYKGKASSAKRQGLVTDQEQFLIKAKNAEGKEVIKNITSELYNQLLSGKNTADKQTILQGFGDDFKDLLFNISKQPTVSLTVRGKKYGIRNTDVIDDGSIVHIPGNTVDWTKTAQYQKHVKDKPGLFSISDEGRYAFWQNFDPNISFTYNSKAATNVKQATSAVLPSSTKTNTSAQTKTQTQNNNTSTKSNQLTGITTTKGTSKNPIQLSRGKKSANKQGGKLETLISLRKSKFEQGGIIKALDGWKTPRTNWYTERYPLKYLIGFEELLRRNLYAHPNLLNAHNQGQTQQDTYDIWNLNSPYAFNDAYTSNSNLVGEDLNSYYDSDFRSAGTSIEDFVRQYNENAKKIRDFWHYNDTDNPTQYVANAKEIAKTHNQLFRKMFKNRSLTTTNDTNRRYNIGYQDDLIEGWMGTNTWKRRMDQYEQEFEDLTDDKKKQRVYLIKGLGYVYKKANGDIGILSPDLIQALGLASPTAEQAQTPAPAPATEQETAATTTLTTDQTQATTDETQTKVGPFSSGAYKLNYQKRDLSKVKEFFAKAYRDWNPYDIIRLASNLRFNRKMYDATKKLRAPLKRPLELNRNVFTGFDIEQEANRQANQLLARSGVPKTSDAAINEAALQEAAYKGSNITRDGQLKSDLILRDTNEKQLALGHEVSKYNLGVADWNVGSLTELVNQLLKAKLGMYGANSTSWNNFWMGRESKRALKIDERQDWQDKYNEYQASKAAYEDPDVLAAYKNWINAQMNEKATAAERYNAKYIYDEAVRQAKYKYMNNIFANHGIYVAKRGAKLDDTQVKKRMKDNDRLARQVIENLRHNSRALENLSRAQLLSIQKILSK